MTDFLSSIYPWTKTLHVISVVAWMAGMFYLPRLYVYHTDSIERGSPADLLFQTMERRLLRAIINPAMAATWVFGLCLVFTPGVVDWSLIWPWPKAAAVLLLSWQYGWLSARRKARSARPTWSSAWSARARTSREASACSQPRGPERAPSVP